MQTIKYALINENGKIIAKYDSIDRAIKECLFCQWEKPWETITIEMTN